MTFMTHMQLIVHFQVIRRPQRGVFTCVCPGSFSCQSHSLSMKVETLVGVIKSRLALSLLTTIFRTLDTFTSHVFPRFTPNCTCNKTDLSTHGRLTSRKELSL